MPLPAGLRRGKPQARQPCTRCVPAIVFAAVCAVLLADRLIAVALTAASMPPLLSAAPGSGQAPGLDTPAAHSSRSSDQAALAEWHSSRRMHITVSKLQAAAGGGGGALQQQQQEDKWASFWASDLPSALETLQSLRDQVSMAKLQQLQKDLEPQDTAGLDVALADTLHTLTQQTHLGAAQAWLKEQVTAEVFRVLNALQHPKDCRSARKLVCALNKGCGFGCQIHHAIHCLQHAVATNRTMVLKLDPWRYSPKHNGTETWQELMALPSSCGVHDLAGPVPPKITSKDLHQDAQEVSLDIIDTTKTPLEIPSMPPDVLRLAHMFNSRPEQWWVGVLASYLLRPSALSLERQADFKHKNAWASPVVGVHVRRTDKISSREAKSHSVAEYMSHVERYCDWKLGAGWQHQRSRASAAEGAPASGPSNTTCTVYLATDEPAVLAEIREQFPHIHVITNPVGLATGATHKRNSADGAQGVFDDTILLASTDYLVGTFSSQVSRLAYELALVNGSSSADPSLHYHSVDSMWYFGGMQHYEWCAKHDFTVLGVRQVAAGQHLGCSTMHAFDAGHLKCAMLPNRDREVWLPPALLGRCETFTQNSYRRLLPDYMQAAASVAEETTTQQGAVGTV